MKANVGGHFYPGCEGKDFFTSDCAYDCGCWMGGTRSGGPDRVDAFGDCPKNPNPDNIPSPPPSEFLLEAVKPKPTFTSFYDVLEKALKGKAIELRSYEDEYDQYIFGEDHNPIDWREDKPFKTWAGTVEKVLQCDNSHVDIIFDRNKPRMFPKDCHEDCYNWHMGDHMRILEV